MSEQGWVRNQKSHLDYEVELKYREGDKEKFRIHAFSTDKIIFFADNGRVFSVSANKLPSGRGFGEPISLTIDLKVETKIISCFPFFVHYCHSWPHQGCKRDAPNCLDAVLVPVCKLAFCRSISSTSELTYPRTV